MAGRGQNTCDVKLLELIDEKLKQLDKEELGEFVCCKIDGKNQQGLTKQTFHAKH